MSRLRSLWRWLIALIAEWSRWMVSKVLVQNTAATPQQQYVLYPGLYVSATDPGAVGAGAVWKDISAGTAGLARWYERTDADDGWSPFAVVPASATGSESAVSGATATSEDGSADVVSTATATGTGSASAVRTVTAAGGETTASTSATTTGAGGALADLSANAVDGYANASQYAEATGTGGALVTAWAETTTGLAQAGSTASAYGGVSGMSAEADGTSARMAFNGAVPIVPPVLPASGGITAQDIAAALVALGLVTQTP